MISAAKGLPVAENSGELNGILVQKPDVPESNPLLLDTSAGYEVTENSTDPNPVAPFSSTATPAEVEKVKSNPAKKQGGIFSSCCGGKDNFES